MKVLDLFSGIGGFSLGLERTGGFETVAFCEIDPYAQQVLRKHWPEVPIYEDIRELTADRLIRDGIRPDVITGGFPCQDISVAGKGAGIGGERSGLWKELYRLIDDIGPEYAVLENVSALLSRGLDVVLGDLAAIGYDAEWYCIPASFLGAIHHRDRVWIIAYPRQIRVEREAHSGQPPYIGQSIKRMAQEWRAGIRPYSGEERIKGSVEQAVSTIAGLSWGENCGSIEEIQGIAAVYTPSLCRANDGIPNRVDRLGCLGNSVVPQIPELIGHAILERAA